jgi:hypothetical protein
MITHLIAWFVLAYGFTNIMVYGSIFQGIRNFFKRLGSNPLTPFQYLFHFIDGILSCMMCCSTWIGFFIGLTLWSPCSHIFGLPIFYSWFFDGLMASGAVWGINAIVEYYEENRPQK